MRRPASLDVLIPLALLALLTILFRAADWDLALERRFYSVGGGWKLVEPEPWRFLYEHGPKPGILIGIASLALLVASRRIVSLVPHRRSALYLVLALLVGPGLLVNVVLRDHWGRPRPRDLALVGGEEAHWEVLERRPGGEGHSFPSGHASSAFYLFAPFFLLRGTRRGWAALFLAVGTAYGVLMGSRGWGRERTSRATSSGRAGSRTSRV
ncbi:MAG: phosphatase PAP2 family protein [Candidatus Eisenbacteria bacterium]